jgi:shikimate dehydrogenase
MKAMFLIGHGISHSLSPAMWNHLAYATGRDLRYGLRDVDSDGLEAVIAELTSGSVLAANVTMPYKSWAAGIADRRSYAVASTGAANLLIPVDDGIEAHNTDVIGARAILETRAPFDTVVMLGAGGTAVAILEALSGLASHVRIVNRTLANAAEVTARFGGRFKTIESSPWSERDDHTPAADLVVSAVPAVDETPIDVSRLGAHALVYDAVYRSDPTAFQRAISRRGLALVDGLSHLAAQAIAMLDPLGFDRREGRHLLEGLERATERTATAWGAPLI